MAMQNALVSSAAKIKRGTLRAPENTITSCVSLGVNPLSFARPAGAVGMPLSAEMPRHDSSNAPLRPCREAATHWPPWKPSPEGWQAARIGMLQCV
jgi:hypothetical protein